MVDVPLCPCATLRLPGLAEMEKSDATTFSATVVERLPLAVLPVTVSVYGPGAVDAPTLTVIVDDPPADTDAGLKPTVVPAGAPLALRLTVCEPPLVTAVLIVAV